MTLGNLSTFCTVYNTLPVQTQEQASRWIYTDAERLTYLILFSIIIILGLIGNFAFMYAVAKVAKLQTYFNFYLVNLAVSDSIYLFMNGIYYIPIFLNSSIKDNIPYTWRASCPIIFGPAVICMYGSIGIIIVLSMDRFFATCYPLSRRRAQNKHRTKRLVVAVWLLAIVLSLSSVLRFSYHMTLCIQWPDGIAGTQPDIVNVCLSVIQNKTVLTLTSCMNVGSFCVPFIIIMITNAKIMATLKRKQQCSKGTISFYNIRRQVTITVLVIVTIFFVFQLPLRTVSILYIIRDITGKNLINDDAEQLLIITGRILVLMNSAINSLIYTLMSSHYREGFKEAFGFGS